MRHPGYFFGSTSERAILDPHNPYVLADHLLCAAYEIPISELDYPLFGGNSERVLEALEKSGEVTNRGKWFWSGSAYPAGRVNIRSTGGSSFTIYASALPKQPLGTVEEASAFQMLHEGAVYLHQGESYVVERLDLTERSAYVSKREVDYYTSPRTVTETTVKQVLASHSQGAGALHFGEIMVMEQVIGYRKKRLFTDTTLAVMDLDLPPKSFDTKAIWFTLDDRMAADLNKRALDPEGGIHALEHCLIGMIPLHAMCDRRDIGGASHPLHPGTGLATIFAYDGHPGGVGISEAAYQRSDELLASTLSAIADCPCRDGCPSCIQSPKCGNNNSPLDKQASLLILKSLIRKRR